MLRVRGDQTSLLAALLAHWSEQQLQLPCAGSRRILPTRPSRPGPRLGR